MYITILPAPFNLVRFDCVDSTNDEAGRLAARGAEDATVVWATKQSAGRGRRAKTWISPGGNLYCSLLLRPECRPGQSTQLGFVAACSMAETIASILPPTACVTCKWPNDILVNGRKIAGILLEAGISSDGRLDWLVVGSGLNVENYPSSLAAATSLSAEGCDKENMKLENILNAYCRRFLSVAAVWREKGFSDVRQSWLDRAHGLGSKITIHTEDKILSGIFNGLDENGALMLKQGGTAKRITAGDVSFEPSGGSI